VTITRGFCIDKYKVTQGSYQRVMGYNPSYFTACGKDCPVDNVTWHKAKAYCDKVGKRLPKEAEWEYAARGGSTTKYYWGDAMDGAYAWYWDNSQVDYSGAAEGRGTHPVGLKQPNEYGLYDMLGNALEWMADWYGVYDPGPVTDPVGPESGQYRVMRGGSWNHIGRDLRVSYRVSYQPGYVGLNLGFRCLGK